MAGRIRRSAHRQFHDLKFGHQFLVFVQFGSSFRAFCGKFRLCDGFAGLFKFEFGLGHGIFRLGDLDFGVVDLT